MTYNRYECYYCGAEYDAEENPPVMEAGEVFCSPECVGAQKAEEGRERTNTTPFLNPYGLGIEPYKIYHVRGDQLQFFVWVIDMLGRKNEEESQLLATATKERIKEIINKKW